MLELFDNRRKENTLILNFLSETQPFVDKLFEAIGNKSYLPLPEQPQIKIEKEEQKKDEVTFIHQCPAAQLFECSRNAPIKLLLTNTDARFLVFFMV